MQPPEKEAGGFWRYAVVENSFAGRARGRIVSIDQMMHHKIVLRHLRSKISMESPWHNRALTFVNLEGSHLLIRGLIESTHC